MKKLIAIAIMSISLSTAAYIPAFAGMSNSAAEVFDDDLPEIEIDTPEIDVPEEIPEIEETEENAPEESEEDSKEQKTEAPEEKTEAEKAEESEPETKEEETVPERTVSIRDDVNNTPEHPTRVIYARRNVVICDNEPIMTEPETTAEETEESISETVEEEIETIPETLDHKVPEKSSSSSLPKTADFSDLMIAGVAVLAVVAAAFAVVANRKKANA